MLRSPPLCGKAHFSCYRPFETYTLIGVQAADPDDRFAVVEDDQVKLWVGFLRHEYVQQLEIVDEAGYEFYFEQV